MKKCNLKKWFFLPLFLLCLESPAITKDETSFFETKIRPVLVQNCYKCHSKDSEKVKGKLMLDSKAAIEIGGSSGPIVKLKNASESLLYQTLTYKNKDLQMPPSAKLPESVIKDFETWINMGCPDPRTEELKVSGGKLDELVKTHWAYVPVSKQEIPKSKIKWGNNEIDDFVIKKLSDNNLMPSLEADKKTLIRRVYYDLIGLPPTVKEVEDFVNDKSPKAYDNLIDKLLALPQYGERWGRYWLDTSRYSDTTGSVNGNRENRYTYSYTYRDYVIRSFNQDKPFNQFILEQIAADRIPNIPRENLAALGFLTLGKDSANANDTIDDRIDVITKGFMATTAVCARCHDHKFDPVSTKDYYALHGVFTSSTIPSDESKPGLYPIKETPQYLDYLSKKADIAKNIEDFIDKNYAEAYMDFTTNTFKFLYGGYVLNTIAVSNRTDYIRDNKFNSRMIQKWAQAIKVSIPINRKIDIKGKKAEGKIEHPAFLAYAKMFQVSDGEFAAKFKELLADHSEDINPFLLSKIKTSPILKMQDLATAYSKAVLECRNLLSNTNIAGVKEFYQAIYKNNGPLDIDRDSFSRYYSDNAKTQRYDNQLRAEKEKLTTHEISHQGTPARAMAILDKEKPSDSYVFIKGEPSSRGPNVPRRFFSFLNYLNQNNFTNGSGRLELAQAIANPRNPLTPRVIVNRVWQHHFEEGFAKTPDDFGTQSEKPANLELLNYLSYRFMEEGWSIKKLHKLILTSATYKQSSLDDARKARIDPYNKYLWRMNITRLDFESLRDTVLYVGGKLSQGPITQPKDLFTLSGDSYSNIRSVYGLVDRSRLPETLTTFDFATPEMTTGKRFKTTVPKQALFLMNNYLIIEQARNVITRPEFLRIVDESQKVESLYQIFYQRDPTPIEVKIGVHYIKSALVEDMSDIKKESNWKYGFRVVSPAAKTFGKFIELSTFEKDAYSISNNPTLKDFQITRSGGKTPFNSIYSIRQWVSPREGLFDIKSLVKIKPNGKEPINAAICIYKNDKLILSNSITNANELTASLVNIKSDLNDKIEFIVINNLPKPLEYSINIFIDEKKDENSLSPISWNSILDFKGPIKKSEQELSAWERYAHILLMSNEMVFVN